MADAPMGSPPFVGSDISLSVAVRPIPFPPGGGVACLMTCFLNATLPASSFCKLDGAGGLSALQAAHDVGLDGHAPHVTSTIYLHGTPVCCDAKPADLVFIVGARVLEPFAMTVRAGICVLTSVKPGCARRTRRMRRARRRTSIAPRSSVCFQCASTASLLPRLQWAPTRRSRRRRRPVRAAAWCESSTTTTRTRPTRWTSSRGPTSRRSPSLSARRWERARARRCRAATWTGRTRGSQRWRRGRSVLVHQRTDGTVD